MNKKSTTEIISISLQPGRKDQLDNLAKTLGLKRSELIEKILDGYFSQLSRIEEWRKEG